MHSVVKLFYCGNKCTFIYLYIFDYFHNIKLRKVQGVFSDRCTLYCGSNALAGRRMPPTILPAATTPLAKKYWTRSWTRSGKLYEALCY
jgi:hypothetical protein